MAFMLASLVSLGPAVNDMYLPAFPIMAEDLSTSASLVQLSLTACLLGLAIGQLIAGSLSDIYGRRTPLLIGLIIFIISSILCALSSSIWFLIVLRFIQGMAGAAGIVIARATVRDLYSGVELTKFFALLMLINGAAPILSPIIGGQLLLFTSWSGIFLVLSIIGVVILLVVTFGLSETLPLEKRSKGGIKNTLLTFRRLLSDRLFMGYALSQGLVFAAMFAYIAGSPFVLQIIYHVSPQIFSILFGINGLGIIIASQLTARLASHINLSKLFISGLIIASIGGVTLLVMILFGAGLYAILPPLFLVVSSVGIVSTTSFSLAMENQSQSAGSAAALIGVISFILGAVVSPLVGIGGSYTAIPLGVVIVVTDVGSLLCYVILIRRRKVI
jgi:DHA1 family bicyclomycin/chloramphenicol resistance-like MFS transporter